VLEGETMTHRIVYLRSAAPLLAAICAATAARAGTVVPTNGMVITEDTTFAPGTYSLPDGVSIGASGITLDMNGAVLEGTDYENYGVTCLGYDDVVIANGIARNYYYGMRIETGSGIQVLDNDLSDNWVDPASLLPGAPFLDINVGPNLGDRTNLGGGLFMRAVAGATVSGNVLGNQENGIDLYSVSGSTVSGNNASHNTGWGIHLNGCTGNVISGNTCDDCIRPGLGDSAGVLAVRASSGNQFLDNSFQGGGDGFFIGNEHGCPSNDNLVQGNNGSSAGANAFEATFSAGNQFIDNIAHGSNYGFWLGYSHTGNVLRGNSIRANNVNGIEIEHGQNNTIEGNEIVGNGGKGIVLRTDGLVHFPPAQYPCLNLPDQAASSFYTIRDNVIQSNFGLGLELTNTTDSDITNNLIAGNLGGTCTSNGADNTWAVAPTPAPDGNIVGGPHLGGNYWDDYDGADTDGDELGDTDVPYTNGGLIALPGDPHPLIGNPPIDDFDNPQTLCNRSWIDLGRNTRSTGQVFDTANGTHFATDAAALYLLEGSNSTRLSLFNPATERYEARAPVPEAVWDGGDLQYGGGLYFATVGVQFDPATGAGKGPKLYAYDAVGNAWAPRSSSTAAGNAVANEALAYDPVAHRLYATVVQVMNGADPTLLRTLAVYDIATDTWIGTTAPADTEFGAASEAEYLGGRIYVWRGLFNGGNVIGSDSYLHIYDIGTDSWATTPTLQSSGVVPGFRSGAFDIWGVVISADAAHGLLYVIGGEANRQVYVFDTATEAWAVAPPAPYDGGWGDGMEYVAGPNRLYQVDGRNALGEPQGTAVLVASTGDIDGDGSAGVLDFLELLAAWGPCADTCCPADLDEDGAVGVTDFLLLLAGWGGP
jgi:parallel beta-helix repeat protein